MNDKILLVDDDPGAIQVLGGILAGSGHLRFATNGQDALRLAHESAPDLILLDAEMPGMSGFQVFDALKREPALADVPVIFVTSRAEAACEVAGFELGAADFIAKPVTASLVQARVNAQLRAKRIADELRRIATIDVLTGIANRRCFDAALEQECLRARRSGDPLALMMIDVDHFKAFNDRYGHPAGDACLRSLAQALVRACVRPADLVSRYGGEEFVVILPHTPRPGARHIARRVLDAIEALGIEHAASPTSRHVTVSIGVASYDADGESSIPTSADARLMDDTRTRGLPAELMQAADVALYRAKQAGRGHARLLHVAQIAAPEPAGEIAHPVGDLESARP